MELFEESGAWPQTGRNYKGGTVLEIRRKDPVWDLHLNGLSGGPRSPAADLGAEGELETLQQNSFARSMVAAQVPGTGGRSHSGDPVGLCFSIWVWRSPSSLVGLPWACGGKHREWGTVFSRVQRLQGCPRRGRWHSLYVRPGDLSAALCGVENTPSATSTPKPTKMDTEQQGDVI